ncbi:MAG: hypothetical protein RIT43_763, partial [Bacteroidota bacterium]
MVTLTLVLDKRRANKEGKFPLLFRIGANRRYAHISTGFHLLSSEFNENSKRIENLDINAIVKLTEAKYLKKIYSIKLEDSTLSNPIEIKEILLGISSKETTIRSFWEDHINSLLTSKRYGGARVYKSALSSIMKHKDLDISFKEFNYKDLLELESKLYSSGISTNGIGVYLRAFRAICNKAVNLDLVSFQWYPFRKFKIKKDKKVPRTLTIEEIRRFFLLEISTENPLYQSWLIGKLIFMLRGI